MTMPDEYKSFNLRDFAQDKSKVACKIDKGIKVEDWEVLYISASNSEEEGDNPYFFGYSETPLFSESSKEALSEYIDYLDFLPVVEYETNKMYYLINTEKLRYYLKADYAP